MKTAQENEKRRADMAWMMVFRRLTKDATEKRDAVGFLVVDRPKFCVI